MYPASNPRTPLSHHYYLTTCALTPFLVLSLPTSLLFVEKATCAFCLFLCDATGIIKMYCLTVTSAALSLHFLDFLVCFVVLLSFCLFLLFFVTYFAELL